MQILMVEVVRAVHRHEAGVPIKRGKTLSVIARSPGRSNTVCAWCQGLVIDSHQAQQETIVSPLGLQSGLTGQSLL